MTNRSTNSSETSSTDQQASAHLGAASGDRVAVLARGEGTHLHFLNNLATIKVSPGTEGSMSVVEFSANRGFGPPLHTHRDEDELVVVLDGEVAFRSGETELIATTGASAYLPHAIPHTFQVLSETARMLSVTSSASSTPQFDQMVAALGEPVTAPTIPVEMDIDPGQVALINDAHGIDILGPPPAPLAG
jgi:quercetin dioxygenase-like cupin family protein